MYWKRDILFYLFEIVFSVSDMQFSGFLGVLSH